MAGASKTWEPPLPTTPTVLESEEQMPLLAKQLVKQTALNNSYLKLLSYYVMLFFYGYLLNIVKVLSLQRKKIGPVIGHNS